MNVQCYVYGACGDSVLVLCSTGATLKELRLAIGKLSRGSAAYKEIDDSQKGG